MDKNHQKPRILLLGKTPPPYMGPSIATRIILDSALNQFFTLIHVETKLNNDLREIGRFNLLKPLKLFLQYTGCFWKLLIKKPSLMLIPISQSWRGFSKDAVFIRLGKIFRIPIVLHLRGSNFRNFYNSSSSNHKRKIAAALDCCDAVIVLGEKLRILFKGFFPDEKIFVVPNGANYSIQPKNNLSDKIIVTYLGNLQPSKGIIDVVTSLTLLPSDAINKITLKIAGAWRDEKTKYEVMSVIEKYRLPVSFYPALNGEEKIQFLAGSDLFVFPPCEPEGHPWVIIEAMAASLPIISTDQGAITESVMHGSNGFIVNSGSSGEIASRINYFVEHPDVLVSMGKKSRKIYEEKFTEECMVNNLRNVFNSVIGLD